jgi:hypothetical protein
MGVSTNRVSATYGTSSKAEQASALSKDAGGARPRPGHASAPPPPRRNAPGYRRQARAGGAPARLTTPLAPRTAVPHCGGAKNSVRGNGSLPLAADTLRVSTRAVWPCAASFATSRVPTRPVAPANAEQASSFQHGCPWSLLVLLTTLAVNAAACGTVQADCIYVRHACAALSQLQAHPCCTQTHTSEAPVMATVSFLSAAAWQVAAARRATRCCCGRVALMALPPVRDAAPELHRRSDGLRLFKPGAPGSEHGWNAR